MENGKDRKAVSTSLESTPVKLSELLGVDALPAPPATETAPQSQEVSELNAATNRTIEKLAAQSRELERLRGAIAEAIGELDKPSIPSSSRVRFSFHVSRALGSLRAALTPDSTKEK